VGNGKWRPCSPARYHWVFPESEKSYIPFLDVVLEQANANRVAHGWYVQTCRSREFDLWHSTISHEALPCFICCRGSITLRSSPLLLILDLPSQTSCPQFLLRRQPTTALHKGKKSHGLAQIIITGLDVGNGGSGLEDRKPHTCTAREISAAPLANTVVFDIWECRVSTSHVPVENDSLDRDTGITCVGWTRVACCSSIGMPGSRK